jgi:hypothetical protein
MSMPANGGAPVGTVQQPAPGQQTQPNQQQQPAAPGGDGSLIGAAAQAQQQDQTGQQPNGGQQPAGGAPDLTQLMQQLQGLAGLEQRVTSQLDNRINGVVSTLRREFGGQQPQPQQFQQQPVAGQPPQQQQWQQPAQPVQPQQPAGPAPADVREARSVFRDAIGTGFTFVDPVERELAAALALPHLTEHLGNGADPDTAGARAATAVADQLRKLRGVYERATVTVLTNQGRLTPAPGTEQRQAGMPLGVPPGTPNALSGVQQGAAAATALFPERTAAGRQAAQQQRLVG